MNPAASSGPGRLGCGGQRDRAGFPHAASTPQTRSGDPGDPDIGFPGAAKGTWVDPGSEERF